MRGWIVCMMLAAFIMMGGTAVARQPAGFAGTAFGTPLAALPSFMTLKKSGKVTYAVNLKERYRINGQAPVVIYGFASGRLFAVYVRLDGLIGRDAMAKRLEAEYGKPATVVENGRAVLRWHKGKVKVKLKSGPAAGALKVGYYSTVGVGLESQLLDMDNVDIDDLANIYEKEKFSKGIKLPPAPAPKGYSPYDDKISKSIRRVQ